jgi:hypothetical protein
LREDLSGLGEELDVKKEKEFRVTPRHPVWVGARVERGTVCGVRTEVWGSFGKDRFEVSWNAQDEGGIRLTKEQAAGL